MSSSLEALKLAEQEEDVYCTIGIYPENIYELNDQSLTTLFDLARRSCKRLCRDNSEALKYLVQGNNTELNILRDNTKIVKHLVCRQAPGLEHLVQGNNTELNMLRDNTKIVKHLVCRQASRLAVKHLVCGVGEIGLQYTEGMPEKEIQKAGFLKQLELASNLNLPVVIHCRDAYGDMLKILKENKRLLSNGGTMHCYSGSKEIAKELLKLDLHISVGGVSTFKNAQNLKETLKEIPLDRLLLETDCPYLAPHPYRGKRNDPSYIPIIAANLAQIKNISIEEVAETTTQNARRLFRI